MLSTEAQLVSNGDFSSAITNAGDVDLNLTTAPTGTWLSGSSGGTIWDASNGTARYSNGSSENANVLAQVIDVSGIVALNYTLSFDFTINAGFIGNSADDDLGVGIWTWNSSTVSPEPFLDTSANNIAKPFQPAGGAGGGSLGGATAVLTDNGAYDLFYDGSVIAANQGGITTGAVTAGSSFTYTHEFILPTGHDRILVGITARNRNTKNIDDFFIDNVVLTAELVTDFDPPTPDPATWAVAPTNNGGVAIAMAATAGTDENDVEYYFTETTGNPGGSDSGWQSNPVYTDTGLNPFTQYGYTVRMRDSLGNLGTTSEVAYATTAAAPLPKLQLNRTLFLDRQFSYQSDGSTTDDIEVTKGIRYGGGLIGGVYVDLLLDMYRPIPNDNYSVLPEKLPTAI